MEQVDGTFEHTPLHFAASDGNFEEAKSLLRNGANVDARNWQNCTPLHFAAVQENDNIDIVLLLLKHNANINAIDVYGGSPLHFAVKCCKEKIVEALLKNGCKLDIKDDLQITPLHRAVNYGCEKTFSQLLFYGADVNSKDFDGDTPLHRAVRCYSQKYRDAGRIKLLLQEGDKIDFNIRNNDGNTPIEMALDRGLADIAKMILLEHQFNTL